MSIFDQAYDEMSWNEVCYRLPGELAVSALKRRVNNLETVKILLENVGSSPAVLSVLKKTVNEILDNEKPDDILALNSNEQLLFSWLNESNRKRVKENDPSKLSLKFLFNTTDSKDLSGLESIMDKVLGDPDFKQSHLRAVMGKADNELFGTLLGKIIKDTRPEVRACVLSVAGHNTVSDNQLVIGLKALAKCPNESITSVNVLPFTIFSELKPMERLNALSKYLDFFPQYRKVEAFSPAPTKEEFETILFAGCIEQNELVNEISEKYKLITEADPPKQEEEEEV